VIVITLTSKQGISEDGVTAVQCMVTTEYHMDASFKVGLESQSCDYFLFQ